MIEEELLGILREKLEPVIVALGFSHYADSGCDEGLIFKTNEGICLAFSWDFRDERLSIKYGFIHSLSSNDSVRVIPTLFSEAVSSCGKDNLVPNPSNFDSYENYLSELVESLTGHLNDLSTSLSVDEISKLNSASLSFYNGEFVKAS